MRPVFIAYLTGMFVMGVSGTVFDLTAAAYASAAVSLAVSALIVLPLHIAVVLLLGRLRDY